MDNLQETNESMLRISTVRGIVLVLGFTVALGIIIFFMYRSVIKIEQDNSEQIQIRMQKESLKLQKKLKEEKRQIEENQKEQEEAEKKEIETKELSQEEQKRILENLKWKRYSNAKVGIAFDYPADWAVQKKDFDEEEFDLWVVKPGESEDPLVPDSPRVTIRGTKPNFIPDHPDNVSGGCAYSYKNAYEFCQEGCEKLNATTSIDFRFLNRGEPIYSAAGFSSVSRLFPRLCIEMSFDQLLFSIASPQDITVERLVQKYDLRSPGASSKISAGVFEAVAIFKHMAGSLSPAK